MDQATFDQECLRLARPRLNLRRQQASGEIVGVWGGAGPRTSLEGEWKHWITVSCDWLNRNGFGLSGHLCLYENQEENRPDEERFVVLLLEDIGSNEINGIRLGSTEDISLPPLEALAVYGSTPMRELLTKGSEYENPLGTYQERCPLFYADAEGIFATLGGWHTTWPDSDDYENEPGRLVLWTFCDSEPWLEVWQRPKGQLDVVSRIT